MKTKQQIKEDEIVRNENEIKLLNQNKELFKKECEANLEKIEERLAVANLRLEAIKGVK